MKNASALIFAQTIMNPLDVFNKHRVTASVPFGARYRVIDFVLSSIVNSDIHNVGVILGDRYYSLFDHLGSGKAWNLSRRNDSGLSLLLPHSLGGRFVLNSSSDGIVSKLRAMTYFRRFLERDPQKYVIIADSNIIANVKIDEALEQHQASGKDMTVICIGHYIGEPRYNIYFTKNISHGQYHIDVHPERAHGLEALGIYIMERESLLGTIDYVERQSNKISDDNILASIFQGIGINVYIHDDYASKIETLRGYYTDSMHLLQKDVRATLFNKDRPIFTKLRNEKPAYYAEGSTVKNSLVADGCVIKGKVADSILFRNVRVEEGAEVNNCILMQDTVVHAGATLSYVMTDKNVLLGTGTELRGNFMYPIAIEKGAKI